MDNLTHSLAGLALAHAGLRRRTAMATAALVIGANLPDVDGLIYFFGTGTDALAFRRGWTHGILAMVVWPFVLSGALLLLARFRRRPRADPPLDSRWLLAVSAIGVWSHPLLDWLNTYGVRLLMPFSGKWFYGDTLFIIDPWIWLVLVPVLWWSARLVRSGDSARAERAVRRAIAAMAVYIAAMKVTGMIGVSIVNGAVSTGGRTMVAPEPVTPFSRSVIRATGGDYELGSLAWTPAPVYQPHEAVSGGRDLPGATSAAATHPGSQFLGWSRFPRFESWPAGDDSLLVRISDLRYSNGRSSSWAAVDILVPAHTEGMK
ncbi:MAG TPA: metal-dependent hydrolase [Gemmatimonadales bacterium]|nr:metal-dependent hydrolase [Gemmatimonadales bacterium]